MRKKEGFSLVELIVAMAIFIIIIGIPYKMFVNELRTALQESSKAGTELESVPSVEIIRKDIEMAGYGLPWYLDNSTIYKETNTKNFPLYSKKMKASLFNDAPNDPPRAIVGKKDDKENGFSYLVLKGAIFGLNKASEHWTYIDNNNNLNIWPKNDASNYNNIEKEDRVIILSADEKRKLIYDILGFYFRVDKDASELETDPFSYGLPDDLPRSVYLIYGIDTSDIRAPFNRVDYFLNDGSNDPDKCADGTHTLERAVMRQSDGAIVSHPLLHCVADFQVYFGVDENNNGLIDKSEWIQDLTSKDAEYIRKNLKQVRVYILMQVGRKDNHYTFDNSTFYVGDEKIKIGRTFDLSSNIKDYQHYRWKLIKLIAIPRNLE